MAPKLKMFLLSVMSTAVFAVSALMPTLAIAQGVQTQTGGPDVQTNSQTPTGAVNCGSGANLTGSNCTDPAGADDEVNRTIKLGIQIFQIIVGLVSVFMLIAAGLKYVTSGGDSGGVSSAKNMILFAIVGLVVVVMAQVIVSFVLNRVSTQTSL